MNTFTTIAYILLVLPSQGIPTDPVLLPPVHLVFTSRMVAVFLMEGLTETQEILDNCSAHGVTADRKLIPIQQINHAYTMSSKGDVKYRRAIDKAFL